MTNPEQGNKKTFLIGAMGAGKTTLGTQLAQAMGIEFVDMDALLVQRSGQSMTQIFIHDGTCAFRAMEIQVLAELCTATTSCVIATSGGTVMSAPNRQRMQDAGVVIWLDVSPEEAARRIIGDTKYLLLPDVDARTRSQKLDRERRTIYTNLAGFHINTEESSLAEAFYQMHTWLMLNER